MSSSLCTRCLLRSSLPPNPLTHRAAAFSTTPHLHANPPKKKAPVAKTQAKAGRTLRLAKNKRVQTARPPAPGERKAARKRVVLSNGNALEVPGLEDLTTENARDVEKLRSLQGKAVGLGDATVDMLRALEAFKPTQGWHLFRRPAALVRRETVELGEALQSEELTRQVLFGERGSGKSVLLLQGMGMANLHGWIVIHFPEAREITNAQTAYTPLPSTSDSDTETSYAQPHYTAKILSAIAQANRGLLSSLQTTQQHTDLPFPLQSNISLARLLDLGANDPDLSYPIWRAFLREITAPSQESVKGGARPPVWVSMDGVDHIMRMSAYLDGESKPIHAHNLAIAKDFADLLAGRRELVNGGAVIAATSASTRPSVPTLDHFLARKTAEKHLRVVEAVRDALLKQTESVLSIQDLDTSELEALDTTALPEAIAGQAQQLQSRIFRLSSQDASLGALTRFLETFSIKVPEWDAYSPLDDPVAEVMETVDVTKVSGLSKAEARGVMEYYARSGMMRGSVTEGVVSEQWSLAGGGVVGELEKGVVGARF